jgi:hypothetical protein
LIEAVLDIMHRILDLYVFCQMSDPDSKMLLMVSTAIRVDAASYLASSGLLKTQIGGISYWHFVGSFGGAVPFEYV